MINVVCSVKDHAKKNSEVLVRNAQSQKDRDYYIDAVEIEVNGEKCLVDVMDIQYAIDKCSNRLGRRGHATRRYAPIGSVEKGWNDETEEL